MATLCVISCGKGEEMVMLSDDNATNTTIISEETTANPPQSEEPKGEEPKKEEPSQVIPPTPDQLMLLQKGKMEYAIVYPMNNMDAKAQAQILRERIRDVYGVLPVLRDDNITKPDTQTKEILVGATNRTETTKTCFELKRMGDYLCRAVGNKLVLAGKTPDALKQSVTYFMENFLGEEQSGDELIYSVQKDFFYSSTYAINLVECDGAHLADFRLVYPKDSAKGEYYVALNLRRHLYHEAGMDIPVVDDSTPVCGREIRIGAVKREGVAPAAEEGKFSVSVIDGNLWISAADLFGFLDATTYLTDTLFVPSNATPIAKSFFHSASAAKPSPRSAEYRVMFHNCWGLDEEADGYHIANRDEYAAALYLTYAPDVLGLNEFWPEMRKAGVLKETLEANGYAEVVTAHVENVMPVFYKPDKLRVIEAHYESYGSDMSKGATMVVFEMLDTQERFIVCCTHLSANLPDYASGEFWRRQHVEQMMKRLKIMMDKHPDLTVLVGGDYNANTGMEACKLLRETYGFDDCHDLVAERDNVCSMYGYPFYDEALKYYYQGNDDPSATDRWSIDHIFRLGDDILPVTYDIIKNEYSTLVSDHAPIMMDFNLR